MTVIFFLPEVRNEGIVDAESAEDENDELTHHLSNTLAAHQLFKLLSLWENSHVHVVIVSEMLLSWRIGLSVIQRNIRRWLTLRNWEWWCLYTQMKPLLSIGRQEDEIKKKLEELEKLKEMLAKVEKTKKDLEEQNVGLLQSKNDLFFQLQVCNSVVVFNYRQVDKLVSC